MIPTILTIDDDPVVRKLVHKAIEGLGYRSKTVPNGVEGLSYLEKSQPELILLDVMMPMVDGFEVLKKIKAHRDWNTIPVMLFTALSDEDVVKKAADLGAIDYLLKPFRLKTVQEKVRTFIAKEYAFSDSNSPSGENSQVKDSELPSLVMLVSEDRILKNRFHRILRNSGIRPVNANSSLEGLRLLNSKPPDIVIIDEDLEVFSAPEFESKIRTNISWANIPILKIAERKTDNTDVISRLIAENQLINTLASLWEASSKKSEKSPEDMEKGRYRLLLMTLSESMFEYFMYNLDYTFDLKQVQNSSDLIAEILNWEPDFVLINYPDYEEDVYGILKRCLGTLGGEEIQYHLFSNDPLDEETTNRIKSSGFSKLIVESQSTLELHYVLYEEFGINKVAEVFDEPFVVLKSGAEQQSQSDREILHRMLVAELNGYDKIIIDLTELQEISGKELEQLEKIAHFKEKYNLDLCVVTPVLEIMKVIDSHSDTQNLHICKTVEEAKVYLQTQTENSSALND